MDFFRIIIVIFLIVSVFFVPWWLVLFLLLLGIFTFSFFYEAIFIALVADLFYDHAFFASASTAGHFIPVFALVIAAVIFISNRFRTFVL